MRFQLRHILTVALTCALITTPGAPASATSQPLGTPPRAATFGAPAAYKIASTGTAFDIASGDFTGTHVKDIVVAAGAAGSVSLLAGRGDGTFAAPVTVYSHSGESITAIATGDFNGDGHLDLAVVSEGGSTQDVVLLLGDGHRHFVESTSVPLRFLDQSQPFPFGGIRSIAVGNISQGALDVAVTDGVNYVSVFTGDGHGGFSGRLDLLAAALPESLIVADLLGHGLADIGVVDNDSSSVYTFANRGDGTFGGRMRTRLGPLPVNAQPVSLAAGDFRRLGRTDLFAVYSATGSPACCGVGRVLLSDGHGSYEKPMDVRVAASVSFPAAGAVADFNGDGILDLSVVAESFGPRQNDLIVLPGNGDGTFSTSAQSLVRVTSGNLKILVADKMIVDDFNGDGKPDVAVALDRTKGMGVVVLLNTTKVTGHVFGGVGRARELR